MSITQILFGIIVAMCSTAGQLCFKKASRYTVFRQSCCFWVLGALLMLVSVFLSVKILQTTFLSALVPFAALVYILTPLGALFIFKEKISPLFWMGVGCIALGVGLTALR